ncbi:glycosyl hydrolases family 2, TIM barrel domain protein, partial [Vibrio parahaemolyticus V-223/04]
VPKVKPCVACNSKSKLW